VQASYNFDVIATDAAGNQSDAHSVTLDINNIDEVPPVFTSSNTADVVEGNESGDVVYTASTEDKADISSGIIEYSLVQEDLLDSALEINQATGEVTLNEVADYEAKPSYTFTVVATDTINKGVAQQVILNVINIDDTAPIITSEATASIDENSGAGLVVYQAIADDSADVSEGVSFSLLDETLGFTINSETGVVTTNSDFAADFEAQGGQSQSFTVVATDVAKKSTEKQITVSINDIDESAPVITSGNSAASIDENTDAGQVVYSATSNETGVLFSLSEDTDANLFAINSTSGAVTFKRSPDFEDQNSFSFEVIATDAAGNVSETQPVTLSINNVDDRAPEFTSSTVGNAIDENAETGVVVYDANAIDTDFAGDEVITFSLADEGLGFSIDANGIVTTNGDFVADYQEAQSQSFTVVATDGAGNVTEQVVTVAINEIDEVAPTITSADTTVAIDENSGAGQVIYTATATDTDFIGEEEITFSLAQGSDAALTIDSQTGAVTLSTNPDHETQGAYSFAVVATDAAGNESDAQSVTLTINDLDDAAPTITSGSTATSIEENSGASQVIYTATADDSGDDVSDTPIRFTLAEGSDNALSIDTLTGAVTLSANPDHESQSEYNFTVIATDGAGNASSKLVSLAINNLDEVAPSITSGDKATAVDENLGEGQVVYTATATDDADTSDGFAFSLADESLGFSIDADTGVVTTNADFAADYENAQSQSFTVVVTDAAGNASEQLVSVAINNLDEVAPSITSGDTATAIDENSGADQVVYTALASDTDFNGAQDITFSLADDSLGFSIDPATGIVTTNADFAADYEDAQSQSFTVVATDATGNASAQQLVSVAINNLDEIAPSIDSGDTGTAVDENSGSGQLVYTATATDDADTSNGFSFSLADDSLGFSIDADTGVVTTNANFAADYENAQSQSFTVVATDVAGKASEQVVSVAINNLDEVAPTITSGDSASVLESSGASALVYRALVDDTADISDGVTFSLSTDSDSALSIDALTGEVTLTDVPNVDVQDSYTFTVIADDGVNQSQKSVTLSVVDEDLEAPVFTSSATVAIDENIGENQVIYTAVTDDESLVTYSLSDDVTDLSINSDTGAVTLSTNPDHESQSEYNFTVIATDLTGNSSEQVVSVAINNLDEIAPTITSADSAGSINENTGAGTVIYTATANDSLDISAGVTFSLTGDSDPALSIDPTTGEVKLAGDADYEAQPDYTFTVIASDGVNDDVEQSVTLEINNLDEVAPSITSGDTATAVDESSGVDQVVYTATATDTDFNGLVDITFSLADETLGFSIDADTGVVTTNADFAADYEDAQSQSFTVVATDATGNSSGQLVSVAINNLDEVAPSITSGDTAAAIDENTGANQVIYIATADDSADISEGVTFSFAEGNDPALTIDSSTGAVTLTTDPDHEAQNEYSFAVIATDSAGNASEAQPVTLTINDLDDAAPTITSGASAIAIDENTGSGQVIYTATADDSGDDVAQSPITFSLSDSSDTALSIDPSTGAVTLSDDPDHEAQNEYSFAVIATDAAGNSSEAQSVTLEINDLDDAAPTITSGATATSIDENSGSDQVVYTATADDSADISDGVSFSLSSDSDTALTIDPSTGVVTLTTDPDHETQSAYSFAVIATDAAGNVSEAQSVSFEINNLDDTAPIITSADTAVAIDENSGANTVIYTATADDSHDISAGVTFRLVEDNNSSKFSINKWNGEVTLLTSPDYEETQSLSFTVVATDAAGNESQAQSVTLNINNLDEVPPTITSASAIALQETYVDQDPDSQSQDLNIFVNEAIYQTTVDDSSDIPTSGATDITYALTDGSDPAINIDANTGEVTLDTSGLEFSYVNQQAYTFGIVATDAANNVSDAHTVTLSVEEAKPREAIVEVTYSGVDGQPTSNGEIQVSNIKPGSTWEYSTDGGANWESGTYDSDIDASAIGEGSFTIVGDGEYTVDVRVINAQDVATALTTPIVVTVDTAPPAPQFVNADSESSVINVVYNESLDATYQPLSADYSITQQGSELTVSTVEFIDGEDADGNLIANSVLQLTYKRGYAIYCRCT
jgi:hypothetical protein